VTDRVLDLLDAAGAHATFFVVGQRVQSGDEKSRALLRRMRDEGHEIGNHSFSHPNVARLGIAELHREVSRTADVIEDACGIRPRLFRPPGGGMDFSAVRSLASTELEGVVLWSVDPSDWKGHSREVTWQRIADALHPGAIILLHDTQEETLRALPLLLDLIQARGYEIVTVSELITAP
jgi:peptidoglycan/xylan/chitin deacetylase (PgdA/CDA1 family)